MADEKSKKSAPPAAQKKAAPAKKEKEAKKDKAAATDEAPKAEKKAAPPRPPADPRLKVFKKLQGKFLPRGPLRDRHRDLLKRWNASPDHGGVTVEELKSLHEDWKKARAKPVKLG